MNSFQWSVGYVRVGDDQQMLQSGGRLDRRGVWNLHLLLQSCRPQHFLPRLHQIRFSARHFARHARSRGLEHHFERVAHYIAAHFLFLQPSCEY